MKKLIITVSLIAVAAVSAQAAKIKWSVSDVTASGTATPEGYYMACFCESVNWADGQDNKTSIEAATAWATSKGATTDGVHQLGSTSLDNLGSGTTASAYSSMQNYWKNSSAAGTKAGTFYAIIFNAADIANATAYMVTQTAEVKFATSATSTQTAYITVGNWTPISPEPTSGILMLLGMGMLALRRKRA